MDLVVVSTTIHGSDGYRSYDRLAAESRFSSVVFIVAGDRKSLPFDVDGFQCEIEYLEPGEQQQYLSSEVIGWNKIMRRNIALLRAIERRPDLIMTIDDDNEPGEDFFEAWFDVVSQPVGRQLEISEDSLWFNYLQSTDSPVEIYPRGFPILQRGVKTQTFRPLERQIDPSEIGLYQGISLGDPDVDAITRIVSPGQISAVREKNFVVRDLWSPYNTQNTVFRPILFPVACVWPDCGRYDDIFASLVWQQLLFNNGLYVHVGDAVNVQIQKRRNILKELQDETEGYLEAQKVWEEIRMIDTRDGLEFLGQLARQGTGLITRQSRFFLSWIDDLVRIQEQN